MFNIPTQSFERTVFYGNENAVDTFYSYDIPKGAQSLHIFCLGGGSGGGGGFSGASSSTRGGGGGGCGAGMSTLFIPTIFLPKTLMVSVGAGGSGGTAGNPGSAGEFSYVSFGKYSNLTAANILLKNANSVGAGGGAGTGAAGGAAGTAPTVLAPATSCPLSTLGLITMVAGLAGAVGSATSTGGGITSYSHSTAGSGGGGVSTLNRAGGPVGVSNDLIRPPLNGGVANGGRGQDGIYLLDYCLGLGGTGGGSSDLGNGGDGGNGGYGCGGGGGGGGITGGSGGNGGNGLVIITAFF